MLCNGTQHFIEGGGGPDQAALNVLLNMKSYKDITNFAKSAAIISASKSLNRTQLQYATTKLKLYREFHIKVYNDIFGSQIF